MKVSTFKKIEEGFFKDVYNQAFKGMSDNPKRDQKEISKRAAPLFISDFIKDLNADLTSALTNNAITITATPASTTDNAQPASTAQQTAQPASTAQQTAQPASTAQQTAQPASTAQQTAQPQQSVQPTSATRQAALQRSQQRKEKRQPAKPVDREEDLEGVAVLGYNENIKFYMLNTLLESIISEQQKLHQTSNGIK
jgi:FtsZ-interacting cell division protein ZipA